MKKIIYLILLAGWGILILWGSALPARALYKINITTDPLNSAEVGQPIKINVTVSELPSGLLKANLRVVNPNNFDSFKTTFGPNLEEGKTYPYDWDTQVAGSIAGQYTIIAEIATADLPEGQNNILKTETQSYTSTPKSNDGGNNNGGGNNDGGGGGGGSVTFDLNKLGKVTFQPVKITDAKSLIVAIINIFLEILGGLAVLALVYSGILYLTAGGDQTKAETAKKNLVWAIIGIVVILLSLVIVNWVGLALSGGLA